jgi:methylated-DNA-protein-cysteine methyltransferase-like protein
VTPLPAGWALYYRIVRRVPRGRVTTYGDVALAAGKPRGARQVGYALAALRGARHDVPWQRVLGARPRGKAAISILDPVGAAMQRKLLEEEGIRFDDRDRIDLDRFGWRRRRAAAVPPSARPSPPRPRGTGKASRRARATRSAPG